jgi:endo-1,4-beta-xylanase
MFTHLSRRHFLQTCAAGIASTHSEITFSKSVPAIPRSMLGEVAASRGYFFGASAGSAIDSDAAYRELYVTQTRVITTDTALKIGTVAPRPGPKNFKPADRLLAFCNRHKISKRGHSQIWNECVPTWVK